MIISKKHYKLISFDLSRKKELDADPKAIQQIDLVGQLKTIYGINADGAESMVILAIFEKKLRSKIKTFSRKSNSIIKDGKLSSSEN